MDKISLNIYFKDKEYKEITLISNFDFNYFMVEILSSGSISAIKLISKQSLKGTILANVKYTCLVKIVQNITRTYGRLFFSRNSLIETLSCSWDLRKMQNKEIYLVHNVQQELKFKISYNDAKKISKWGQIFFHTYKIKEYK